MALMIVLRFLLVNQKMELIKNGNALYRDNGPLTGETLWTFLRSQSKSEKSYRQCSGHSE